MNKVLFATAFAGVTLLFSSGASHALSLAPAPAGKGGRLFAHGGASPDISYRLAEGEASKATPLLGDLTRRELPIHHGEVTAPLTGVTLDFSYGIATIGQSVREHVGRWRPYLETTAAGVTTLTGAATAWGVITP